MLTIRGSKFHAGDSVLVNLFFAAISSTNATAYNLTCPDAVVVDSSTVTCVLPAMPDASVANYGYARNVGVQVGFNASSVWTNTLVGRLWRDPGLSLITGVSASGCGPTTTSAVYPGSPLQVSGCGSNATLTLTGSNLNSTSTFSAVAVAYDPVAQLWVVAGATVLSASPSQVVLQLPDINGVLTPLVLDTPYQYYLSDAASYSSNVFIVSFSSAASPPASSSHSLSSGAIAGIVVAAVVVAVVLMALVLVCVRRRSLLSSWLSSDKPAGSSGGEGGFGSALRPRRLEEDSSADYKGGAGMTGVELQ